MTARVQDPGEAEHPEQAGHEFEDHLKQFQKAHADDLEDVDLIAEYEEAKQDYMCAVDLRKLDKETTQHISNKEYSDVLVIVTGGTLCMVNTEHGYQPEAGLAARLMESATFYDKKVSEREGCDENTLITPVSPFGSRIRFKVHEFENLIDSSCVDLQN